MGHKPRRAGWPKRVPPGWAAVAGWALVGAVVAACAEGADLADPNTRGTALVPPGPDAGSTAPTSSTPVPTTTTTAPPAPTPTTTTEPAPTTTATTPAPSPTPTTTTPPPGPTGEERCLELVPTQDACSDCTCAACTDPVLACADSGNAANDADCSAIVECGQVNSCSGIDCYCGTSVDCTAPDGPCIAEIQSAANSTDLNVIAEFFLNTPGHPIQLAGAVGGCAAMFCTAECGFPPPM